MAAAAWADSQGIIGFSSGRAPKGMIVFARHRDVEQLRRIVSAKCRHGYDGKTLLVPGVPEASDQNAALQALEAWRDWSFQHYRIVRGAALITDDAGEVL